MKISVFIFLFFYLLSFNSFANNDCNGKIVDGEREIPFVIYLFDKDRNRLANAKVKIFSKKESNEAQSDSNGKASLFTLARTYGFFPDKDSKKSGCEVYNGFNVRKGVYLNVEKEGFQTIHIELAALKYQSRFNETENIEGMLALHMLAL